MWGRANGERGYIIFMTAGKDETQKVAGTGIRYSKREEQRPNLTRPWTLPRP